jgi:predicted RNA methylase
MRLVSCGHDSARLLRATEEAGAAFLDVRGALGFDDLAWPRTHERSVARAAKTALLSAEGEEGPRQAAERLGRLCERLSSRGRDRRKSGSYYTPGWAADFIADTVVQGVLTGRRVKPAAALSLKVLDPAAGAGAFAVAAVEALAGAAGEALAENDLRREAARSCVFAVEKNALAAEVCRLAVWLAASRPGRPAPMPAEHVRLGDALAGARDGGDFDIVIGNPPWGVKLPAKQAEGLASAAPGALRGHRDSYVFFLQLGADLAREDGGVGMLLPDTVLWQVRYEGLRRAVLEQFRPLRVVLLGDRVFATATAPSCMVCLVGKGIAPAQFAISDLRREKRANLSARVSERGWLAPGDAPLEAPHSGFVVPPRWRRDMLERLTRRLRSLGDMVETFTVHDVGINYSRAEAGRAILYSGDRRHRSDIPITRGRDFGALTQAGHSAWLHHDWQERVRSGDRVSVREAVYRRVPKILLRQTGDRPVATVDRRGAWFGRSVIAISARDDGDLLWLAAILNSKPLAALYRAVAPEAGRPFAQVKVSKLKLVPLPPVAGTERLGRLAARALEAPEAARRERLLGEIDEAVAEAYRLDEGESRRVVDEIAAT